MRMMLLICLGLALLSGGARLDAYSGGPPDGKTGRPGEGRCNDCHSFLGSGDSTALTGLPGNGYRPDSLYRFTLQIHYAAQRRWGFELTAVDSLGNRGGALVVLDSIHTQASSGGPLQYLKQTSAGTYPAQPAGASWEFGWRAPPAGTGTVSFYWCGNAANNNGNSAGDYALPSLVSLAEARSDIEDATGAGRRVWFSTSLANEWVIVEYEGDARRAVPVFDASGTAVRTLRPVASGNRLRLIWDGRDAVGARAPGGSYFLVLGDAVSRVVRVQLIK